MVDIPGSVEDVEATRVMMQVAVVDRVMKDERGINEATQAARKPWSCWDQETRKPGTSTAEVNRKRWMRRTFTGMRRLLKNVNTTVAGSYW